MMNFFWINMKIGQNKQNWHFLILTCIICQYAHLWQVTATSMFDKPEIET